jgi:hypothetical protein
MRRVRKIRKRFGGLLLISLFCFINFLTDGQEAQAGVLDFGFTYTSDDTSEMGNLGDTILFISTLTNTGTQADSYRISLTENLPTPPEWLIYFCYGACGDTTLTDTTVYLEPSAQGLILLEMLTRDVCGAANVTMTVTSVAEPDSSKSITFYTGCVPVTDRWGLLILISLLFISGFYLIFKRVRPVRTT